MPCEAARSYESDHRMSTLDVYSPIYMINLFCLERVLQMAANGREDADISLFDAEGCLVESPL
jgi:hypothetical protein